MTRLAKLQFSGPAVLFLAVCCQAAAIRALSHMPSSGFLWYINLQWFGAFQHAQYIISAFTSIHAAQLILVALPLMLLATYGYFFRRRLALALSSNLCFGYVAFLIYADHQFRIAVPDTASLAASYLPPASDAWVPFTLLAISLVSAIMAHFVYLRTVQTPSTSEIYSLFNAMRTTALWRRFTSTASEAMWWLGIDSLRRRVDDALGSA